MNEKTHAPLVALTASLEPKGGGYQQPRVTLYGNYVTSLLRVGLTPVLITPAHDEPAIQRLVSICSGLVLSGGDDIDPSRYGEEPIPELGPVNPARDAAELRALEAASDLDLPILGICRGHQMLNVFFGGTLYQDIPTQLREAQSHVQTGPWAEHHHEVEVEQGSRIGRAVGQRRLYINSYHHQAIARVADGLEVTATADDGMVEAVESQEHRWVVGVQWHPERHEATAEDADPNIRVFAAFAHAVREQVEG